MSLKRLKQPILVFVALVVLMFLLISFGSFGNFRNQLKLHVGASFNVAQDNPTKYTANVAHLVGDNKAKTTTQSSDGATTSRNTTHTQLITTTDEVIPQWLKIQRERQERLKKFCKTQPAVSVGNNYKDGKRRHNWIYSDNAGITYCSVPKVACTTWKKVFQVFYGKVKSPMDVKADKDKVHDLYYQTFDKLTIEQAGVKTQMYYNFIITRHPLERVVSAYRNKLEKPTHPHFQQTFGSQILRMYRKNMTKAQYNSGKGVTFGEFVDYLIKVPQGKLDEHWRWVYGLCNICGVKYDFIAEMKTMYEDSDNILKAIGWYDRVQFPSSLKDNYKKSAIDLTPEYLNKLTDKQLEDLYNVYKNDFLAFGYEFNLKQIRNGNIEIVV